MRRRVAAGLTSTFASHFTDRLSLAEALRLEVIHGYARPSTGRKYLITPNKKAAWSLGSRRAGGPVRG
jgi:hypothetical protein